VIEQLDPVLVGYAVPYAERLAALDAANVATIEELLARVELRLKLPGGIEYPWPGRPFASNVRLDANGNLKVWAAFPNPDRVLLPGLPVDVESIVKTGQ
jgi:membrane fusion protein (multidrug efflux system)